MLFGNNREQLRRTYVGAWRKYRQGLPLQALEAQIADVIREHPEYHALFDEEDCALAREFPPELGQTNPFLHLGMHLGIREQVATRRPVGIERIHATLTRALGSPIEAEHQMMECLGEALWQAQRNGTTPDEAAYMACLRRLVKRGK